MYWFEVDVDINFKVEVFEVDIDITSNVKTNPLSASKNTTRASEKVDAVTYVKTPLAALGMAAGSALRLRHNNPETHPKPVVPILSKKIKCVQIYKTWHKWLCTHSRTSQLFGVDEQNATNTAA